MKRKQATVDANPPPLKKVRAEKPECVKKMQWQALDPEPLEKKLNKLARKFEKQVDDDWHDGWEEQEETLQKWAKGIKRNLQAILTVGVGQRIAFDDCHAILMTIGNSWRDLDANAARFEPREMIGSSAPIQLKLPWNGVILFPCFDSMNKMHPLYDTCGFVWRTLLRDAANREGDESIPRAMLFQAIKDATDNGIKLHSKDTPLWTEDTEDKCVLLNFGTPPCPKALDRMVEQKTEWQRRKSNIKKFAERTSIDRRFYGTPERRTRDYHLQDFDLGPDDGFFLL